MTEETLAESKALEISISALIQQELERAAVPDTEAIAKAVARELSDAERIHYATQGIKDYVRTILARHRSGTMASRPGNSARWDAVKADQASGDLDLQRYSVFTGKTRKWLLDCTPNDLLEGANFHAEIGTHHLAASEQLTKLAGVLKRANAQVVGDLPEKKVIGVLSA